MNQPTRKFSPRAARALVAAAAGAAAFATAASAYAEPLGFLETIKHHTTLINTVPDNGDQNPYAVVIAPVTAGAIKQGDVLVGNFNNSTNLQGTGSTIINYRPDTKQMTVFATAPQQLSGGQQQRVALARALAPAPTLVMLDEPFSSLDAALRLETRQAVASALAAAGATAVLVTHDQSEALSLGHEVAVLWNGRLIQTATPETLYQRPVTRELASFVGEAVLLPGMAQRDRVSCELGDLALAAPMSHGAVDVMVRPEQIRLLRAGETTSDGAAYEAVVTEVVFQGQDAGVALQLQSGSRTMVRARVPGYLCPRPGEQVRVAVDGKVTAYLRG